MNTNEITLYADAQKKRGQLDAVDKIAIGVGLTVGVGTIAAGIGLGLAACALGAACFAASYSAPFQSIAGLNTIPSKLAGDLLITSGSTVSNRVNELPIGEMAFNAMEKQLSTRAPHDVSGFLRQLPDGWHASPEKIAEAIALGIDLPEGCTWVDPYSTGKGLV